MSNLQLTVPAQNDERAGLRIKPREVQTWLDNLPFLDLHKSARLAHEQLRLMNRQPMIAGARLEILGHFLGTYQRLEESISGHSADAEALRQLVKRLCQDIGFGYKIVINELVNKRSGFMETRNLPMALIGAIHTLGLQLFDCYAGYQRAPRALWSECLALYGFAWQSGRETFAVELPGFGRRQIDESFRLSALLHLADPYQLPAGMAAALRSYFSSRVGLTQIHGELPEGKNCFQLQEAFQETSEDQDPHLYLELDDLLEQMQADHKKLEQTKQSRALGLGAQIPALPLLHSLAQIINHWQEHPTRVAERVETHARIDLVSGLNAAYCMINRGRCFDPELFLSRGNENVIDLAVIPAPDSSASPSLPTAFTCAGINRSTGGLAARYSGQLQPHPRVGQLVAVHRPGVQTSAGWVVAVCRWLVENENGSGFELGLQYIAREPRPVVVRSIDADGLGGDYQPAIAAVQKRGSQTVRTLITGSGLPVRPGSTLAVIEHGRPQPVVCSETLLSGSGFQRFIYKPAEIPETD